MGVAEDVIAALSGGGAAVARMEIARLVSTAVLRLSGDDRPRSGRRPIRALAIVAHSRQSGRSASSPDRRGQSADWHFAHESWSLATSTFLFQ
jgi:hypothetical protein